MKRFFFLLCMALCLLTAKAQFYAGGSFAFTHDDNSDLTTFMIAPEIGYNLNDQWAVAAELGFSHYSAHDVSANAFHFAPYARWNFFSKGIVRLFLDGGMGISTSKIEDQDRDNGFEIGIKPGIALDLNQHFSFITKYGFVGFRDNYRYNNSVSGISASSEDLSFGFIYTF